jgi:hypothetical protein
MSRTASGPATSRQGYQLLSGKNLRQESPTSMENFFNFAVVDLKRSEEQQKKRVGVSKNS